MSASYWKPAEIDEKFGIAIANFNASSVHDGVDITVGRFVHIYEKCENWYRGCLYDQHQRIGIFPRNIIYHKKCNLAQGEGLLERLEPEVDPLILYLNHLTPFFIDEIFDSYMNRIHDVDVTHHSERKGELYNQQISALMIGYRHQCFMSENPPDSYIFQTKKSNLHHHWQVNNRLFNIMEKRFDVLVLPSLSPASVLYPASFSESGNMVSSQNKHFHLFVENSAPFGDQKLEIVIGIFNCKTNEYTSELIVCTFTDSNKSTVCGIIKDIPPLDEHQMLVIKLYKIGSISDDKGEKNAVECRRPFAFAVVDLKNNCADLDKGYDLNTPLFQVADFCMVEGAKIKEFVSPTDNAGTISLRLKRFYGSFEQVLRSTEIAPKAANLTVVKSIPREDSERSSQDNLTELYIHLKRADFEKLAKGKLHNIKIQVCVYKANMRERGCIYYGSNDATDEYQSPVLYHNNSPVFNDLIKISLYSDISSLEVRFFVHHISRNKTRKTKSDIAIAVYRPIAVVEKSLARPNVNHALSVHKGGIDTLNFRDHSVFSTLKSEQVIYDFEDKSKQISDAIFIRPYLITNHYTTDEHISNLLNRQSTDNTNLPQLINNIESISSGYERRKFCFRMIEVLWRYLEEQQGVPEIYVSTLNRFKDIGNSKLNREELKSLARNIQNVDSFYRFFMENMRRFLTAYNNMKNLRLTIKHMDLFLDVLEILVEKSSNITKSTFADEMFELLNGIEISESNEHGFQLYSLYSSELPRIINVLSNTLTFKQQLTLVMNVCKVKSSGSLFIQMTLMENVLDIPMFADTECHEILCSIFVTTITAISHAMEYKSYYLKTEAMMRFYERHFKIAKTVSSNPTAKLVCSLHSMVCELLTPASDLIEKNTDMMIKLVVCFVSFLKLIDRNIFNEIISSNNNLLKVTKQFTVAFKTIIAYKDIPLNYRFHWGLVYNEIYRVFAILHSAALADHNAGKIRSSSFNYIQSFSTNFILSHEAHSSLLSESQRQDFSAVFGRLSDCTLLLVSELHEALKGDIGEKNFEHLRDFVKVCLVKNESLSRSAISVLLGIIKLRISSSTKPISEQITGELCSIFYYHLNDSGNKSNISIGSFLTRYKEQSDLFWKETSGKLQEEGLKIMEATYEALDHLYEQQNLPKVTLSPFLTLYISFSDVLYNVKTDPRLVPNSALRYIEMLLEMSFYEIAAFAFLFLADPLEWDDTELSEISVSETKSSPSNRSSLSDFSVAQSGAYNYETLVLFTNDSSNPFILKKNIPRQSSKLRKLMFLQSSIDCFLNSSHKFYAVDYIKEIIDFYERSKSNQFFKEIAAYYSQLSEIYIYSIESPPLPFRYYLVAFYGEKAPSKLKDKEFIYVTHPYSLIFEVVGHLQKEFPSATIHQRLEVNPQVKVSQEMEIVVNNIDPYVESSLGEKIESSIIPEPTDIFMMEYPKKVESKFHVNDCSITAKVRKLYKTVAKLPGYLKMVEIYSQEDKFFAPLDLAIDMMDSKTAQLAYGITDTPKRLFISLVKGVVDAPINGGPKNYMDAFFDPKYLEAYPDQGKKVEKLRHSFKAQMERVKASIEHLFDDAPDHYVPLFMEFKKLYNDCCDMYNSKLKLGCLPITRSLEMPSAVEAGTATIRNRSGSSLNNSKGNTASTTVNNTSPSETSGLSVSPVEAQVMHSYGSIKPHDKFNTFVSRNFLNKFGSIRKNKLGKTGSHHHIMKGSQTGSLLNNSPLAALQSIDVSPEDQSRTSENHSASSTSPSSSRSDSTGIGTSLEPKPSIKSLFGKSIK